jgi:hypothetical protein
MNITSNERSFRKNNTCGTYFDKAPGIVVASVDKIIKRVGSRKDTELTITLLKVLSNDNLITKAATLVKADWR